VGFFLERAYGQLYSPRERRYAARQGKEITVTALSLEFYATDFCWNDFSSLMRGGEIVHIAGVLNLKWADFSAWEFVREAKLGPVEWQAVRDDTPSTVRLKIEFQQAGAAEVSARLTPFLHADLTCSCTETVERQTAVTEV
jgi:hypothetical protein